MSNKPNAEYGNELPIKRETIPFKLNHDECVISYKENKVVKYFKVQDLTERQMEQFSSASPKEH